MSFKKWIGRTALAAVIATSLCLYTQPLSAGTISTTAFKLTCRQAQVAVNFLENLKEEVPEWVEKGYITSDQADDLIAAIDNRIDRIKQAATAGCTF